MTIEAEQNEAPVTEAPVESAPPEPATSMRDDIAAAVRASSESRAEKPAKPTEPEKPAAEPPPPAKEGRDEKGRFAPKKATTAATAPATEPEKPEEKPADAPEPEKPAEPEAKPAEEEKPAPAPVAEKPPGSWKPLAKEHWKDLPAEVRSEVLRVDREVQAALRETSEARKLSKSFRDTFAPYEAMVRSEGGEPLKAVESLLGTAYTLRYAPAPKKAQLVAEMIRAYGVPIDALDAALSGTVGAPSSTPTPVAGQPQPSAPTGPLEYRDPRLDALIAKQAEYERIAAEKAQRAEEAKIAEFSASREFFEDVREDMAELMEVATKRGRSLSLEDAYNRAIALNADIQKIIEQRKKAAASTTAQAVTAKAKAAASSIRSTPAPAPKAQPSTLREILEESIAEHR